jgi:hypothetical protein
VNDGDDNLKCGGCAKTIANTLSADANIGPLTPRKEPDSG